MHMIIADSICIFYRTAWFVKAVGTTEKNGCTGTRNESPPIAEQKWSFEVRYTGFLLISTRVTDTAGFTGSQA